MIVTIESQEKEWDIQADDNSNICNALEILAEKGMIPYAKEELPSEIYSMRRKRKISTGKSYRENGIYQGDILRIG